MQGDLLLDEDSKEEFWNVLKDIYGYTAGKLKEWDKVHKQHLNRYLSGFYWQHKICTGTDWENFWNLRVHPDADPAMYDVAKKMKESMDNSTPIELMPGQWHLLYITFDEWNGMGNESAIKCSTTRIARVSYNNHDGSDPIIPKDIQLHDDLISDVHMSPTEHPATPMNFVKDNYELSWEKGITHMDRNGHFWSGNLRGWIQYRQLLECENQPGIKAESAV
ncbi:hypothetical protein BCL69_10157 [Nitrosomonas communis]|uniref:Uncharacterized protein n=2 Tax=Nitrosomonadaceae TaxID=206379 RepID=A0A5D3YE37_9PROT|nr:hypothetical protein BCL69_10157 [Nitrosomonas communis]